MRCILTQGTQGDYSPTSVHRHTGISIKITQISLCSDYHQDSYFSPPSSINPHVSKPKSMFNFGVIFLIHMFIFKFFSPLLPPSLLTQKGYSCSADSGAYLLTQQPKIQSHSSQVCEEQLSHHLLLSLPGKSKKRPNKAVCSQLCYQGTWHYQLILDYYSSPRKIKHPFVVKCNWLLWGTTLTKAAFYQNYRWWKPGSGIRPRQPVVSTRFREKADSLTTIFTMLTRKRWMTSVTCLYKKW